MSLDVEPGSTVCVADPDQSWITPILRYIKLGEEPSDPKRVTLTGKRASSYSVIEGRLFCQGFSMSLLKFIEGGETGYILTDIDDGICDQHLASRAQAKKVLRAGCYWPTMAEDAKKLLQKCNKCQRHADVHMASPAELATLASPCPFVWWGFDILGAFPTAPRETPFRLTYGSEAVISVKVGELTWKKPHPNPPEVNKQVVHKELGLVEEIRDQASLQEVVIKRRTASHFNEKVIPRSFEAATSCSSTPTSD